MTETAGHNTHTNGAIRSSQMAISFLGTRINNRERPFMKMKKRINPGMHVSYHIIQLIQIRDQYNKRFIVCTAFYGVNLLNGLLICGITPNSPNSVGRVEDDPALLKRKNRLFDYLLNSFPV